MENVKSVKFNFIMNSILTASSILFPVITFPYVSRVLGPAGNGKIGFAFSIITYFGIFAQLGIPTYGIKACARVRDNKEELSKTVFEIMIINIFSCIIAYLTFIIFLLNVPRLYNERTLFLVTSLYIVFNTLGVEWLYRALEQYQYITCRSIIFKVISVLAMFLLVHHKSDYVIYAAISIFASSGSNVMNLLNLRKFIVFRKRKDLYIIRHLKPIGVFFAMSIAVAVYKNLDTVMLGFITNDEQVGYYCAAIKIRSILVTFVASLGTVLLPRASYLVENKMMEQFNKITKKAINFVILIASPLMIYCILYANECILFLSGIGYTSAVLPMQFVMPTLIFIGLTNIIGIQILVPLGKEKYVMYSTFCGAIVDLICNSIFIPIWGARGTAIATLLTELAVLVYQIFIVKKDMTNIFKEINWGLLVSVLLSASFLSSLVKFLEINNFIRLVLSSVIFFAVYIVSLYFFKEQIVVEICKQITGLVRKRSRTIN